MLFRAIFSHWVDTEQPALDHLAGKEFPDDEFWVEAPSKKEAEGIARQYEGLETHAYEGIGSLKETVVAAESDKNRLSPITVYKRYIVRRDGVENKNHVSAGVVLKVIAAIQDYLQLRGLSPERAKDLAWGMMKEINQRSI